MAVALTYKGWNCQPAAASTSISTIAGSTDKDTKRTDSKYADCLKVGGTGLKIATVGAGCCADMLVSTVDANWVAITSTWNTPYDGKTKDSQSFYCLDQATYDKGTAVQDPFGTSTVVQAKTRCAWDVATIACDKGSDKKCTDSTDFGSSSCCYYTKIGKEDTAVPASSKVILDYGGYPSTKDTEKYFCMKTADSKFRGYIGATALKAKQDTTTLGYKINIGVGEVTVAAGYCAGAKALAASAAVATLVIASNL